MTVSYSRAIPPGGKGEVVLKIQTEGKAGEKISKRATIYTNDPQNATLEVTLAGEVISAAEIEPQSARLIGKVGENLSADITITPSEGNPFDITVAKAEEGANIQFQFEKKTVSGKQTFILFVKNRKTTPGRYFDKIILKTTSALSPELQVRVYGIIRDVSDSNQLSAH